MNEKLEKEYKLKEMHFEIFKDEFEYWIKKFGLAGWEVVYSFGPTAKDDDDRVRAGISTHHEGRILIVHLDDKWIGMEPSNYNLAKSAYHEAMETLLSDLLELIYARNISKREVESKIHTVIRTFENSHFDQDYFLRQTEVKDS